MIPKSGNRFSEKIMLKQNVRAWLWFNPKRYCPSRSERTQPTPQLGVAGSIPFFFTTAALAGAARKA